MTYEFINLHPKATEVVPIFGKMFTNEPAPIKGEVSLTDLPGFGAELNKEVELDKVLGGGNFKQIEVI